MNEISSFDAKQRFGLVLDEAQRAPLMIRKHNRPVAVVLSISEYERLKGLNFSQFTAFCDRIGQRAEEDGVTELDVEKWVNEDS